MIHHVTVETTPALAEACACFYRLLGFERVEVAPALRGRVVWLEREGSQIHLLLCDRPTPQGSGHFAVLVADFDATFELLENHGHEPEHRARYWGSPRAYVHDPAGNLVEFMAYPPRTGRDVG